MAHEGGAVPDKKVEGLPVGQVALAATDAVLQKMRIAAVLQEVLVVVCLQESRMALPEMPDQVLANVTEVREDADSNGGGRYDEAARVCGVMRLRKRCNGEVAHRNRLPRVEDPDELRLEGASQLLPGGPGDKDRQLISFGKDFQAADMVVVLMGNKDALHC